jgi:hypothetical protein
MPILRSTHCSITLVADGTITAIDVDPDGGFAGDGGSLTAGAWTLTLSGAQLTARAPAGAAALTVRVDQKACHLTVLGRMPEPCRVTTPALAVLPDRGCVRLTNDRSLALAYDAWRRDGHVVTVGLAAAAEAATTWSLEVLALHPAVPAALGPTSAAAWRRAYPGIMQLHARLCALANNASSDLVAPNLWMVASVAERCPDLVPGLPALDLVRDTLARIQDGLRTYCMVGYTDGYQGSDATGWKTPHDSLDTWPSLVLASAIAGRGPGRDWARTRWVGIQSAVTTMLRRQDASGLLAYDYSGNSGTWEGGPVMRPANWWDTIGYGHHDAYSNALAYRALRAVAALAAEVGNGSDAAAWSAAADRLQAAYLPAFRTSDGWIGGWRSRDGELHDHRFVVAATTAVACGVVAGAEARALMERVWRGLGEHGFSRFELGLPGNLRPVPRADYTHHEVRWGGGERADGSDAFQIYENGGATLCHTFQAVEALHRVAMHAEADGLTAALLGSVGQGAFRGEGRPGFTRDWKAWDGTCWGYEGFLADGYLMLLAPVTRGTWA